MTAQPSSDPALEYLRRIIKPEEHKAQITNVLVDLKRRASLLLVNRDLTEDSPNIPEEVRTAQLADIDMTLTDIAWRIQQLEGDLTSLDKSVRNITGLDRARRRELERAAKKEAKKAARRGEPVGAEEAPGPGESGGDDGEPPE